MSKLEKKHNDVGIGEQGKAHTCGDGSVPKLKKISFSHCFIQQMILSTQYVAFSRFFDYNNGETELWSQHDLK